MLAQDLDVFRKRAVVPGKRMIPSHNLPFLRELWLDGCLGVEARKVGLALADRPCDWGWRPDLERKRFRNYKIVCCFCSYVVQTT
jgi:hypothetical protein